MWHALIMIDVWFHRYEDDGKGGKLSGFLPIRRALTEKSEFIDFNLLTAEERNMKL